MLEFQSSLKTISSLLLAATDATLSEYNGNKCMIRVNEVTTVVEFLCYPFTETIPIPQWGGLSVSMVSFQGELSLAVADAGDGYIHTCMSVGGQFPWNVNLVTSGYTATTVSLTVFKNKVWMAYIATESNGWVYQSSSTDGSYFNNWRQLMSWRASDLSITSCDGYMFAAHISIVDSSINVATSDASGVFPQGATPLTTDFTAVQVSVGYVNGITVIAAVATDGQLYIAQGNGLQPSTFQFRPSPSYDNARKVHLTSLDSNVLMMSYIDDTNTLSFSEMSITGTPTKSPVTAPQSNVGAIVGGVVGGVVLIAAVAVYLFGYGGLATIQSSLPLKSSSVSAVEIVPSNHQDVQDVPVAHAVV